MKIINRYDADEFSTPRYITLNLKIDAGKTAARGGIHWHIAEENEVRYASIDDKREEMLWVDVRQEDGSFKRYVNRRYAHLTEKKEWKYVRVMDCVDCHNRATHIYESPAKAIDDRLSKNMFDRSLPYAKREMLTAVTANYNDREAAMKAIANRLRGFYRGNYPGIAEGRMEAIDRMITVACDIYNRNIHHIMDIKWGTYPAFIGHERNSGCFRCHHEDIQDEKGEVISYDCTLCHSILSYGEDTPFEYLETPDTGSPNFEMHKMLRQEFMKEK
jgi:hypothetical protein